MEIEITERAFQGLAKLPKNHAFQILTKIAKLEHGLYGDIKRLHKADYGYRLRSAAYRILFDMEGSRIVVQKIGHRKDIYD